MTAATPSPRKTPQQHPQAHGASDKSVREQYPCAGRPRSPTRQSQMPPFTFKMLPKCLTLTVLIESRVDVGNIQLVIRSWCCKALASGARIRGWITEPFPYFVVCPLTFAITKTILRVKGVWTARPCSLRDDDQIMGSGRNGVDRHQEERGRDYRTANSHGSLHCVVRQSALVFRS